MRSIKALVFPRGIVDFSSKTIQHLTLKRNLRGVRNNRKFTDDEVKFSEMMKRVSLYGLSIEDVQIPKESMDKFEKADSRLSLVKPAQSDHENTEERDSSLGGIKQRVTLENQYDLLASKVTPLWNIPYEKQLKIKYFSCLKALKNFGAALKKTNTKTFIDPDNTPCALDRTIPSPQIEAYRNKDEFSIRPGVDGNPKTVGFFLDSISENPNTLCVEPDSLVIIKDAHKHIVKEFQNYICNSDLPACIKFDDGGYWRNIIVRSNSKNEIMAVIIMHPRNMTNEQLKNEMNKLKDYFSDERFAEINLKSLYFQACIHTRCTHAQAPFQLLLGEPYLLEEMNGYKYRISPESFFQVNTKAAENLYKIIFNASKANKSTTILDICCGMGPVSLTFSKHVKRCIGIDMSEQAIEDAKVNAKLNNIENVEFHAGRCEYLLRDVLSNVYAEELVAVLNPSRSPLSKLVISTLRELKYLKKIIFVTCKPEAMVPNFIDICRSPLLKERLGQPFVPLRAVPVDLFPHTHHCELVMLLQRL